MARNYTPTALRAIGEQCGGKLPPASAVQRMFLYELQRETEAEKLFQGQMFELARVEHITDKQETRLAELEQRVTTLSLAARDKDIEDRLATSKTRTDYIAASVSKVASTLSEHLSTLAEVKAQLRAKPPPSAPGLTLPEQTALQAKIEKTYRAVLHAVDEQTCLSTLIKDHESKMAALQETFVRLATMLQDTKQTCDANTTKLEEATKQVITTQQHATKASNLAITAIKNADEALKQCTSNTTAHSILQDKVTSCDNDIGILFDERDVLAALVKQLQDHQEKQDGLIRALTLQLSATSPSGTSSPTPTQVLPVATSDGHPLNLRVPKGQPLVMLPHHKGGRRDSGSASSDSL